jgi:glycosyltransferase involved in cell wall biosynthesis
LGAPKNVLLITYYWPPSGGAGVQRWLKFVKYFNEFNVHCTVITVDPKKASYAVLDESLSEEIPANVEVHYTNTREPFAMYKRVSNKSSIPHAGFANENTSFLKKVARFIRGNFFIPDARKGWNKFAYAKASELISTKNFDAVIVTSPPHSTQLVGLKLKRKFNIHWIADLRDPWTDIYYYKKMLHTTWAKRKDLSLEKQVLEKADKMLVVSESIRQLFGDKVNRHDAIHVLPNGYDHTDFERKEVSTNVGKKLHITYTGTISSDYPIDSLLESMRKIGTDQFSLNFVGTLSPEIKEQLSEFETTFPGYVKHSESIDFLLASDIVLLIIPNIENNAGILTGKLFEYIGSQKAILAIGPTNGDAAKIIDQCEAGKVFEYDDVDGITNYLQSLIEVKAANSPTIGTDNTERKKFSRRELTKTLVEII